jgi:hypothetical protein
MDAGNDDEDLPVDRRGLNRKMDTSSARNVSILQKQFPAIVTCSVPENHSHQVQAQLFGYPYQLLNMKRRISRFLSS